MKKLLILLYGSLAYTLFLGVFIYAIGFIGNFGVANSIDALPTISFNHALIINLCLLALFAVQHSVMARKGFKRWITKYIPKSAERSTYVLMSNIAMIALFYWWQPMGGVIWHFDSDIAQSLLLVIYLFGWAIVLISTFLVNHFHLFGLQQIWYQWRDKTLPKSVFVTPSLYRLVRHPLYVGWIIVFWAAPVMTVAHLLFALMCTAYIVIAIRFEEQDLIDEFGETYKQYKKDVPMLIPAVSPKK